MGRMDTTRHFVTSTPSDKTKWQWDIVDNRLQPMESLTVHKSTEEDDEEVVYSREILDGAQFIESLQLNPTILRMSGVFNHRCCFTRIPI